VVKADCFLTTEQTNLNTVEAAGSKAKQRKMDLTGDQKMMWLSTEDAAAYLRTTAGSIRNLVYRRRLSCYKPFGRLLFNRDELDRLVRAFSQGG